MAPSRRPEPQTPCVAYPVRLLNRGYDPLERVDLGTEGILRIELKKVLKNRFDVVE